MTILSRSFQTTVFAFALAALASCGDDDGSITGQPDSPSGSDAPGLPDAPPGGQTIRLNDDITQDITFTANNQYVIPRLKYLFVKNGATLTIEPGTTVLGEQGAVLVITRGSKLMAEGTAADPILFTSAQPDGMHTRGWWGGVLILGAAPINNTVADGMTEATYEAFTSAIPEGKFGGTDPDDDSGVLRYVRIEFAGFNFVSDREFNNLTLAGVGRATEVDYVQVHAGSDDGIEFFGGTVNVKHIVSTQNGDDGFDTDNGWQGSAQFIIVQNVSPDGAREASNGYESDNHGVAASYATPPRTMPNVANVTLIGDPAYTGGTHWAMIFRRGTGGHYFNHIVTGFPLGVEVRDQATKDQLDADALYMKNSIIYLTNPWPANPTSPDIDEMSYFTDSAWNNRFADDPGLSADAWNKTAPSFKPATAAPAMTGGAIDVTDTFLDTTVPFVGAMGQDDWTQGWTAYPQPMN